MGKPKAIESPEQLQQYFEDYKKWAKENPFKWHDFVGKDADEVWKERERPLTWFGFEAHLCKQGILTQLTHYEQNTGDAYTEYLPIIRAIKAEINQDIVEGASAGVFQQNIAARLTGLVDKKELDHKGIPEQKVTYVVEKATDD